ncbi:hypothetical protein ZOSMA_64G00920 [Zostera marina]|uniref:Uncharacterized protein n=1 Tax=Zostera marina TaxID=29655 RepID=A0A0K9NV60_ZOSMR|nr:hypothetical protein ZOSMA_64G00920 [Zostera marina]
MKKYHKPIEDTPIVIEDHQPIVIEENTNKIAKKKNRLQGSCMLVPWASWDQWNFVRESLFSDSFDSVATALRRVTAWRSRGCLPIAIQATASLIEIRQKDYFFSLNQDFAFTQILCDRIRD